MTSILKTSKFWRLNKSSLKSLKKGWSFIMMMIGLQFFAHKKGGGSTKNGRDSNSKRLGAKRAVC